MKYSYIFLVRIVRPIGLTLILLFCGVQNSFSQSDLLDNFAGSWQGSGKLFGRPATFTMSWEGALKDRFLRLTFSNPAIIAEAFYSAADSGKYKGTWVDSRGMILPLSAVVKDSMLETIWGSPETEQGRTQYRLLGPDKIEVADFVMRDGQWAQFGQASYTKKSAPLDRLSWLLGAWRRETEKSITEESWLKLSDHTLEGQSTRIAKAGGDTVFTESLRLLEMEGELFYLPKIAENPYPVPFKMIAAAGDSVVFENLQHDFPQRLIYKQHNADSLTATAAGVMDGANRRIDFHFARKK